MSKKLESVDREQTVVKRVVPLGGARVGGAGYGGYGGGYGGTPILVEEDVPITINIEEFQYSYRCKHCGHEWSEKRVEEHKG